MTTYTIKPLAWEQEGDIHSAITLSGCCFVFGPYCGGKFKAKFVDNGIADWLPGHHESLEAAKQACADHWEGMFKQGLEVCDDN